ncbi:MAG: carbohydrate ABC transporter permease [Spirochaetaceae bacterium]|nr:MAG: carbohydrate ABC transporter permease [Spirochaetaceae bacterium]
MIAQRRSRLRSFRTLLADISINGAVAIGGVFMVIPFVWMITASFKTTTEIFRPATILPASLNLENYIRLFTQWPFAEWFVNSLLVAGSTTIAVLLFCSMAGFAFSKYRFRGRTPLFFGLLGSAMIPFPILVIPLFVIVSNLGWTNSLVALVVPFVAPAIGIFLMRQYMEYVPTELLDAPRIDGAGELRIYLQIVLPTVRPGLATLAIITFINSWNNFLWPLVVIRREASMTLPVGMANMLTAVSAGSARPYGPAMAAATLVSIPTIVVFLLVQRYYIAGIAEGAGK